MISEYMQMINNKFSSEINKHVALKKINEALFVNTYRYFASETTIYLGFYCIPLILNMFYIEDPYYVEVAMILCGVVTGCLFV